jgi:SAM-dependent methyltransferase
MFRNPKESHEHSLKTLNSFYEHDDFMESIGTLVDLGCGNGLDLEWWATRTTRDDVPQPLNIQCTGVDQLDTVSVAHKYENIVYQRTDFEVEVNTPVDKKFDILWCHDAFQYCMNPVATLSKWWDIASDGGMLAIIVPQTTNIDRRQFAFTQHDGCYYHYSLVSLIHMLAISGWDCREGFFLKEPGDEFLHAVVYKSEHKPMDPRTTRWYDLVDKKLLPVTADKSVMQYGYLDQRDLVLPWLDKNFTWYGK